MLLSALQVLHISVAQRNEHPLLEVHPDSSGNTQMCSLFPRIGPAITARRWMAESHSLSVKHLPLSVRAKGGAILLSLVLSTVPGTNLLKHCNAQKMSGFVFLPLLSQLWS